MNGSSVGLVFCRNVQSSSNLIILFNTNNYYLMVTIIT